MPLRRNWHLLSLECQLASHSLSRYRRKSESFVAIEEIGYVEFLMDFNCYCPLLSRLFSDLNFHWWCICSWVYLSLKQFRFYSVYLPVPNSFLLITCKLLNQYRSFFWYSRTLANGFRRAVVTLFVFQTNSSIFWPGCDFAMNCNPEFVYIGKVAQKYFEAFLLDTHLIFNF